jgi:hypothetical protein
MASTYNITENGSTTIGYSGRFETTMAIYGTFAGSTVAVSASYDNITYIPLPDTSKTIISTGSNAIYTFKLAGPVHIRFVTSGGSDSLDLKITIG